MEEAKTIKDLKVGDIVYIASLKYVHTNDDSNDIIVKHLYTYEPSIYKFKVKSASKRTQKRKVTHDYFGDIDEDIIVPCNEFDLTLEPLNAKATAFLQLTQHRYSVVTPHIDLETCGDRTHTSVRHSYFIEDTELCVTYEDAKSYIKETIQKYIDKITNSISLMQKSVDENVKVLKNIS